MRILTLGGSYTMLYMARHFPDSEILFLSRTADALRRQGLQALNYLPHSDLSALVKAIVEFAPEAIVDPVPPPAAGAIEEHEPYQPLFAELARHASELCELPYLFLSSTSVYGPESSPPTRFDESSEPAPEREEGVRRLAKEEFLYRQRSRSLRILRPAAIYGPDRSIVERFRRGGTKRAASDNRIVSRIHVLDLCRLIEKMIAPGLTLAEGRPIIVNGIDLHSTENREYYSYIEGRFGVTIIGSWREGRPYGRYIDSLYAARLLGSYCYPDYRSGLRSLEERR